MKLEIRGYSDDIIDISGDIEEEFYHTDDGDFFVVVSDGTVLRIAYDANGMWRIYVISKGDDTVLDHHQGTDEDDDYSDIVTLTGESDIEWVIGGKGIFPR